MYDHIPASLYRNILVETNGKKYRLRISEGEVSERERDQHRASCCACRVAAAIGLAPPLTSCES